MNMWIEVTRPQRGDDRRRRLLIVNDEELKQLTDEPNLVRAARAVHAMARACDRQAGEHAPACTRPTASSASPPTRRPTSSTHRAGDTFAGGSWLRRGALREELSDELLRRAMAYGPRWLVQRRGVGTERMRTLTVTRSPSA